jgi:hypothetical protein
VELARRRWPAATRSLAPRRGADVILTDLNEEQRTALAWSQVRDHNAILPKVRVEAASARQALEMVGRCDVLVVDTPAGRTRARWRWHAGRLSR